MLGDSKIRLQYELTTIGRAVSIDGLTLKVQGRHYYAFTMHYLTTGKLKSVLEPPVFGLETSIIIFLEGSEIANAEKMREMMDVNLKSKFEKDCEGLETT